MADEVQATLREASPMIVIDLRGQVTANADTALNDAYRQACVQSARNILLNFAKVDYLNSAGIAIIIGILTETRQQEQRLLVTGLTPHYRKIFEIMGLSQYAPVFETEDAARQFVASQADQ